MLENFVLSASLKYRGTFRHFNKFKIQQYFQTDKDKQELPAYVEEVVITSIFSSCSVIKTNVLKIVMLKQFSFPKIHHSDELKKTISELD